MVAVETYGTVMCESIQELINGFIVLKEMSRRVWKWFSSIETP